MTEETNAVVRGDQSIAADNDGDAYGDLSRHYIELAVQYFVTARGAVFCQYMQVSAINFHHAFEMLFKARLLAKLSANDLDNDYKRKLPKLWREFKKVAQVDELGRFDAVVDGLHEWESQRYPKPEKGSLMTSDMRKGLPRPSMKSHLKKAKRVQVPHYHLVLEALDELFAAVVHKYPLNPEWLRMDMHEGVAVFERENAHQIWASQGD